MTPAVRVAAAVIVHDGQVLLAQRPPGKIYAGYWEFPGGKLEVGETPELALARELREELGLEIFATTPWLVRRHRYAHGEVELNFLRVTNWRGEPHPCEGQAFAWQRPEAISVFPLLPVNASVVRALQLPSTYAITRYSDLGLEAFLHAVADALRRGIRLIQLRELELQPPELAHLAHSLHALASPWGAKVLLNGDINLAREWALEGVHWSSRVLLMAHERPLDMICGASCHNAYELGRAQQLDLDFAVLGPVAKTMSHPDAAPLGWAQFASLIAGCSIPVYALGGMVPTDLTQAFEVGAQGIAMRRGAWE